MKMKKALGVFILLSFAASSFLFAAGTREDASQERVNIDVASPFREDHVLHMGLLRADELLRERTDGRVSLTIFPSNTYGTQADSMTAVKMGSLDMFVRGVSGISDDYALGGVLMATYLFRDYDHWATFKRSDLHREMMDAGGEAAGVKILGSFQFGFRHATANRPLRTPADFRGVKMRIVNVPSYAVAAPVLGAEGVPLPVDEVYMALNTRVVDAQENPYTQILSLSLFEVQEYLIHTAHMLSNSGVMMSTRKWQSLSSADQQIVQEVFEEAMAYVDELTVEAEEELLQQLKDRGMTVIEPQLQLFRDNAKRVLAERYSSEWLDLYSRIASM